MMKYQKVFILCQINIFICTQEIILFKYSPFQQTKVQTNFNFINTKNNQMNPEEKPYEVSQIKKHVQNYAKPNDRLAWLGLAGSFFFLFISVVLISLDLRMLGWGLLCLNNVRFFIQFHDMAHFSYFSSLKLNIIVGKIIGIYTHFPFNAWRDGHNHHHKHFGNLDKFDASQTILFTKEQYQNMKGMKKILARILRQPIIFFTISSPFVWFVGLYFVTAKKYRIFSATFLQKIGSMVFMAVVLPYFGISFFEIWLPMYFSQILGTLLFHLQHSVNMPYRQRKQKWNFMKASVEGSTFLYVPYVFRPFTYGIEYHHIHHYNSNVPSYMINICHEEFDNKNQQHNNWDSYNINRVPPTLALKSVFNVMLDEKNRELVPFSYSL